MRVFALTHLYPRAGNDLFAPYNRHQLRNLALLDEVRVMAPVPWTSWFGKQRNHAFFPRSDQNKDGIQVDHPIYFFPPRILQSHYGVFYLASIRSAVRRLLKEFRPQVIYSCWAHPDGWAAVRLAREHGLPVLIKVVGSDVLVLSRNRRRRRRVAEALCEADGVVAVSRDLADHVMRLGVDPRRVHVVPEGIDSELFSPGDEFEARARLGLEPGRPGSAHLLFVGNLLLSKGAGVLLEACALLQRRGVPFLCHLVGKGRDEGRLRAMASELGIAERVNFAGPCPQSQLVDWYRACDLFVLPSFSEGIPNVLREAMMCGRAFVATRVGGIPEITRPQVGRLVEPGNVPQLADAVEQALAHHRRADRRTALELNVSWERSARMLSERLHEIASLPHSQGITYINDRIIKY